MKIGLVGGILQLGERGLKNEEGLGKYEILQLDQRMEVKVVREVLQVDFVVVEQGQEMKEEFEHCSQKTLPQPSLQVYQKQFQLEEMFRFKFPP